MVFVLAKLVPSDKSKGVVRGFFTPRVRSLRAIAVNVPLARPHPTASGVVESAPLVLLDLETDLGLVGRSYVFCYTPIALRPIADLVEALRSLIQGDPVAPLVLAQKLQARFRLLGPQGFTGIAMAGIDMAAWDVLAKSAGLSLTRLLGGQEKPIPAYHSLGMAGPEGAAREAAESIELGFRCVKFKVGYPLVEQDRAVVRAARNAASKDLQVMVDYNQSLSVPEAIRRVQLLEDEALVWVAIPTTRRRLAKGRWQRSQKTRLRYVRVSRQATLSQANRFRWLPSLMTRTDPRNLSFPSAAEYRR